MSPSFKPTGPISLQGAGKADVGTCGEWELPKMQLSIASPPSGSNYESGGPALMNPVDMAELSTEYLQRSTAHSMAGEEAACMPLCVGAGQASWSKCCLQLKDGSDCVLTVRPDPRVPRGTIQLDEVQQFNLRVLPGEVSHFRLFVPPDDGSMDLCELEAEVRLMTPPPAAARPAAADLLPPSTSKEDAAAALPSTQPALEVLEVDAQKLSAQLSRQYFDRIVAVNELLAVPWAGGTLLARVTLAHTLSEADREDAIGYHCYRGRVTPHTALYLQAQDSSSRADGRTPSNPPSGEAPASSAEVEDRASPSSNGAASSAASDGSYTNGGRTQHAPCEQQHRWSPRVVLTHVRSREARPPPTNIVNVTTSDGEWFPVKKRLMRPCIALTKAVRDDAASCPEVTVDVDTLTFDRVLLFLEAHALGRPPPQWSLHLVEDLARAADVLGLRPLQDYCQERLGRLAAGLRLFRWREVTEANGRGEVWLVLDGMVLDVRRWLPEHPGGARIIPAQSLNMDCARFFEMYHASRESFLYLKDFYLGEVLPEDRPLVPIGSEPPSEDFMTQLRSYTGWRLQAGAARAVARNL